MTWSVCTSVSRGDRLCWTRSLGASAGPDQPSLHEAGAGAAMTTITSARHRHVFAALDVLTGKLSGMPAPAPPYEFVKFLRTIDARSEDCRAPDLRTTPPQAPSVRAWLDKHPRFQLHFTPTSSSWLNLVDAGFGN